MRSAPCPASHPASAPTLAQRHRLARLGLAWLANMQVMMFAFPGYFRHDVQGADNLAVLTRAVVVMNWISLAMTVPVVLYCAWPLWCGALRRVGDAPRGIHGGGVRMEVPVVLGIVAAFVPSVYATWMGVGEVYFESVTMFVAFVLTARYLEAQATGQTSANAPAQTVLAAHHTALSRLTQRLAFWFVVVQLILAGVVGACWYVWSPAQALPITVALLVMSCPCAMAMALPTAFAAARAAARHQPEAGLPALTRATHRVTLQNLTGAIAWHLLMVPLAAFGWVQPWLAAIAMLVSSLAVATNSWWLYRRFRAGHQGTRPTINSAQPCWP